ncbi:hypothetical protein ACFVIM_18195 [Streptomyces sp. NPDC057638]|uniref:hypothetical protein n=1 Tax=Streptomyces sp. NPDC057638 TaxID=3346190 RepID=UPI00367E9AAE
MIDDLEKRKEPLLSHYFVEKTIIPAVRDINGRSFVEITENSHAISGLIGDLITGTR